MWKLKKATSLEVAKSAIKEVQQSLTKLTLTKNEKRTPKGPP